MRGVMERLEKFEVPMGAPAILGRTCTRALDARWQTLPLGRWDDFFDRHVVHPMVAKIVEVRKGVTLLELQIAKARNPGIAGLISFVEGLPGLEVRESPTVNLKIMQMAVRPTHRLLNRVVELRERR
jgi:hypothetical protein